MAEFGRVALILSLALAAYATFAGALAVRSRRRRLAASAQNALYAAFGAAAVATAVLVAAFARRDFGFVYVYEHSSTALTSRYTLSAFWGGQEGSLLLWLVILASLSALAIALTRRRHPDLVPYVVPVLGGVQVFFALLLVFVVSPFATQSPVPAEGLGLNPSLQNPYMVAHPPFLYLGYVGVTIPFAYAIGSLWARRADEAWIVATRKWTLAAWLFLGIGQLLGARWAYLEVGWGGYYGWDPVENAALMPWLAATAFLHSVMVQEKKGMLKVWNMILVIGTFSLALFGTFLTRSGVISSIHAFAQGPIGIWFLTFIVLVLVFSIGLLISRLPLLRSRTRLESIVSREATFLYNNLLLVALTLTILWGVIFPMLSELVKGESRVMGPGYYNFFLRTFGLPLLLLMGIAPLIAWRRASIRSLVRTFAFPFAAAIVCGIALIALGAGSSPAGLVAYTFSAFVTASIVLEFARGTAGQRSLTGASWLRAFGALIERNRRRYGGYIVHVAIVLFAVGVAGSSLYQDVNEGRLSKGQSMAVGDYSLAYRGTTERLRPGVAELRAQVDVVEAGATVDRLAPGKNGYTVEAFFSKEVATRTNWLTGEDLYLIVEEINADGSVYLRAFVKPLVNLIWFAGAIFIFGSLIALWPDAREARRLASRRRATPLEPDSG